MASCLLGTKPLSEPMVDYSYLAPCEDIYVTFESKHNFHTRNWFENVICKMATFSSQPQYVVPFASIVLINSVPIQLSAIIARTNITWFCIWYNNDWGKICIRGYIHKRHPIACLSGKLLGVFCEDLGENLPRYSGTALYMEDWYGEN